MAGKKQKPYRICYAYDSETTNIDEGISHVAFPILHQLGKLDETPINKVDAANVEEHVSVAVYRHAFELHVALEEIMSESLPYVPVVMCHNLSFDMYGLASWLNAHDVRVLAKSQRKPISFTVMGEDGSPVLVIWDTLVFAQKPLEKMGAECGYEKVVGSWDYNLIRCPQTELSPDELDYAKKDIYALFAWMGYFCRRNPDIQPSMLGLRVVTKTGIVRMRRYQRFAGLKGNGMRQKVGYWWMSQNQGQLPKTDDELFTMHACTRGGFTFCSSRSASVPYDFDECGMCVHGYDATSQHPAQMVSHRYPVKFHETSCKALDYAFSTVVQKDLHHILTNWGKPFAVAFNACFKFTNVRPKQGTVFERDGIFPLASARFGQPPTIDEEDENQAARLFEHDMHERGYHDYAEGAIYEFGKLVRADLACVYITELTAWEISRAYDWDSVEAVHGYMTSRFVRPSDMSIISVMQFYRAKNAFKEAREEYYSMGTISNGDELRKVGIAESTVSDMESGRAYDSDVDFTYLGIKADLNSLFGIEACNEFRRETELSDLGIVYTGEDGLCNAPKKPKAWYQFGQRIVGWSRIAQICVMELCAPHVAAIVNGDTDSVKFLAMDEGISRCDEALEVLARSIDAAKDEACKRVKCAYPSMYDKLEGIGHYVHEFTAPRFCASWNKAYLIREMDYRDGHEHCNFTLAGIPTKKRKIFQDGRMVDFPGVNGYGDLYCDEHGFSETCNLFLGYNVTYGASLIHLNMRSFPKWGDEFVGRVTDYKGDEYLVSEPCALNLHAMTKTVNDTRSRENLVNMDVALSNNPDINTESVYMYVKNGELQVMKMGELIDPAL